MIESSDFSVSKFGITFEKLLLSILFSLARKEEK